MIDRYKPKQVCIRAWQVPYTGIVNVEPPSWMTHNMAKDIVRQVRDVKIPLGSWIIVMPDSGYLVVSDVHFRALFEPMGDSAL